MNSSSLQGKQLYINGRFLTQQTSGVQAFAKEVCRELIVEMPGLKLLVPENAEISNTEFQNHIFRTGSLKGHLWEQLHLPKIMRSVPDAMLLNLCNTGPLAVSKQAVTIHDLAFFKNPEWFNSLFGKWYRFLIPGLIKKSRIVFTVSVTVKSEIAEMFNLNEEKIIVTPNKVSNDLLNAASVKPEDKRIMPKNYFLMVGTNDPRKNFSFIESWFETAFPDHYLVITGGSNKNFSSTNQKLSNKIIRLGFAPDSKLKWLYENAIALINPSLYEGFGIPNLEAMAFDCPVICSDISVFHEICKDAATYFNPTQRDSIQNAVSQVMENKMLTESKTLNGRTIFTKFQSGNRSTTIIKALFQ